MKSSFIFLKEQRTKCTSRETNSIPRSAGCSVHPGVFLWEKVSKEGPKVRAVTVPWEPLLSTILWEVVKGTIQFFFQTKALLSPVYQDTVQTGINVHRSRDCYAVVAVLNV